MKNRLLPGAASLLLLLVPAWSQEVKLPNKPDSLKFLVVGDTGTGGKEQYEIGKEAADTHKSFPFNFAIMLGDNLYGGEHPDDFEKKFERPYAQLLQDGVKFYAALGNHDNPNQRFYKNFNMNGERYYSFKPREGVRFFALDSNYMDQKQLEWLEKELAASGSDWKIAFFHHPLYSAGETHGPDRQLRNALEPLFHKYGVHVVFSGHEHFYERIKPQAGIYYWILGSSAKLRKADIKRDEETALGFDKDNTFMLVEIDKDDLYFQTISRNGQTIDSGTVRLPKDKAQESASLKKAAATN